MSLQTAENPGEVYNPFQQINDRLAKLETLIINLKDLNCAGVGTQDVDEFLNIRAAANYLNLSVPSMYRLCGEGKLASIKKGKKILFIKKELTAWLKEGRRESITESDPEKLRSPSWTKKIANH